MDSGQPCGHVTQKLSYLHVSQHPGHLDVDEAGDEPFDKTLLFSVQHGVGGFKSIVVCVRKHLDREIAIPSRRQLRGERGHVSCRRHIQILTTIERQHRDRDSTPEL